MDTIFKNIMFRIIINIRFMARVKSSLYMIDSLSINMVSFSGLINYSITGPTSKKNYKGKLFMLSML